MLETIQSNLEFDLESKNSFWIQPIKWSDTHESGSGNRGGREAE